MSNFYETYTAQIKMQKNFKLMQIQAIGIILIQSHIYKCLINNINL